MQKKKTLRALAVILPQFHPFPENDEWWGKGFTEWTNTVKARPRFKGHYQPHLPADLGFYDLRLAEIRKQQADLAKHHSIYGFCYYHYWFDSKLLMEKPVQENVKTGEPDFPFMLCWANENWSRRWDGQDQEVLIKQEYSPEDHKKHAKWLCENAFKDKRYIKIDGKPVFLFYRPDIIPELKGAIKVWRQEVKSHGFKDIYLIGVRMTKDAIPDATELGFDATAEWQPDWHTVNVFPSFWNRIKAKFNFKTSFKRISYEEAVRKILNRPEPENKHFECVFPGWDNTARRKHNAFIVENSTPEKYANWLEKTCENAEAYSEEENFIFLNAWNEWAEGNHLEPDKKWGLQYLEKTKDVLQKYQG